jgi:2,4-diketo-3-deoxy-L-fuconate hydrolase
MKLFRFGEPGQEKPGAVDGEGRLRDLSLLIDDWTPRWLAPERLRALQAIALERLPLVPEGVRIGAPLAGIRQFLAIGLNYRRHAAEAGMEPPDEPLVFNKAITCISGPNDDIVLPPGASACDWEVELGVVIGREARRIDEAEALSYVAGYVLANDVAERDWQTKRSGQWVKGKSFDGFGPIGPWLVTADELPDPQAVPLKLAVNGQVRQDSSTSDMIFPVARIVSHLSQFMTLLPGDLVITGTPEGVGMGMKPPVYLQPGDVVTLEGGVLGRQRQVVRAPR